MCTIMTFSSDFYLANEEECQSQMRTDALQNDDGYSVICRGEHAEDATFGQFLSIDQTIAHVEAMSGFFNRVWVHCRASTSPYKGLKGCHGFRAGDWFVMHNGVINNPSSLPVDSMRIAELIKVIGVNDAIGWMLGNEGFNNTFLVNPESGAWAVMRSKVGQLHRDEGEQNFSTHPIGDINIPVEGPYSRSMCVETKKRAVSRWEKWEQ